MPQASPRTAPPSPGLCSGQGIVTLCDANYFPGLLMMHRSVQESFPCSVVCYDLDLTTEQKEEASRLPNLTILPLPDDPLIEAAKTAMAAPESLAKKFARVWPLWICPLLIKHAPLTDVFWFDCDLFVLRNLAGLFAELEQGPVFTPENNRPDNTPNKPELYDLLPIARTFDPLYPTVNGGVSGWRKGRDSAALDAYIFPVARAVTDPAVRAAIAWHDQGSLIWAIQSCGLEHRVQPTRNWNLCVRHTPFWRQAVVWDEHFLDRLRREVPDANIVHWNGWSVPWSKDEHASGTAGATT